MNGQKRLLIILLAALLLSGGYAFWGTPRQQRLSLPAEGAAPQNSRQAARTTEEALPQVQLQALLGAQQESYGGYRRNIFAPLYRSTAPSPAPKPVAAREAAAPPSPTIPVLEVQPEREIIRRELARFTFLGFLQKDAEKTVFLSSGNEIFVVKKGDRFGQDRDFLITHISNELLQVRQGDDPRTISVTLVEQAPLMESRPVAPAVSPPRQVGRTAVRRSPPPVVEESFPSPEAQDEDEEVKHE